VFALHCPHHFSGQLQANLTHMRDMISFSDFQKSAFLRGFWKGMAAPLVLFSSAVGTPHQRTRFEFEPLPKRSQRQGVGDDWRRVGNDLRRAAGKFQDRENTFSS
jgi:hypothetical protein